MENEINMNVAGYYKGLDFVVFILTRIAWVRAQSDMTKFEAINFSP